MIEDLKKYQVHRMPKGIQQVHKNYGLWIHSSGGSSTNPDSYYECPDRYFEFYSISHMYTGRGKIWLPPDRESELHPGHCVIICPNTINRYGGAFGERYIEDSMRFSGPVADMLRTTGILRDGAFDIGKGRRLLPIIELAQDPAMDSQINANIALQKLLVDIYNETKKLTTGVSVVDKLIETLKEQIDRWWTVDEMAEFCDLSDDQFRRVFQKHTGVLPKIYLDRLKLQKASELLLASDMKVWDIAAKLGYVDPYHFSRRFKKIIGFSPKAFRKEFSNNT
jgi:AraC-like DNA-binding protein